MLFGRREFSPLIHIFCLELFGYRQLGVPEISKPLVEDVREYQDDEDDDDDVAFDKEHHQASYKSSPRIEASSLIG